MNLRRRMEGSLDRDIREYIEMETRDNIERGMPPEKGSRRGTPQIRQRPARNRRHRMWADRMLQDTRYALGGLRRNPVFASVAILTLALGIGMNTAVFSVVSAVLIKPLPYPDAERIVWLANYNQRYHFEASTSPDFTDWRTNAKSFEEMAGYLPVDKTMLDGDQSSKHPFASITPAFWHDRESRSRRSSVCGWRAGCGRLVVAHVPAMVRRQSAGDGPSGSHRWPARQDCRRAPPGVPFSSADRRRRRSERGS
jgi:hypothetical protein